MSLTDGKKSRTPIQYSTFLKIFTKKKIFLKSEAPKALYSSHSFIVSALKKNLSRNLDFFAKLGKKKKK